MSGTSEKSPIVRLRGADVAPLRRYYMEHVVLLQRKLMEHGDRLDEDPALETLVIDNIEGTLLAFVLGITTEREEDALAELVEWKKRRLGIPNNRLRDFAQETLLRISHLSRVSGLFDVTVRPEPRPLTPEQPAWREDAGAGGESDGA